MFKYGIGSLSFFFWELRVEYGVVSKSLTDQSGFVFFGKIIYIYMNTIHVDPIKFRKDSARK